MAEILDRIHAEIRERLAASRAAAQEYERLQAALAALGGPAAAPTRRRRAAQPRAPRGANREAVLRALEERPGASASELAAASRVERTALYGVLNRLIERGEVAKEELPGGATGYRLLREAPTAFPARPKAAPPAPTTAEPPAAADAPAESPAAPADDAASAQDGDGTSAPLHDAASAPDHDAASAPDHDAASAPDHDAASAPARGAASAPDHDAASAPAGGGEPLAEAA